MTIFLYLFLKEYNRPFSICLAAIKSHTSRGIHTGRETAIEKNVNVNGWFSTGILDLLGQDAQTNGETLKAPESHRVYTLLGNQPTPSTLSYKLWRQTQWDHLLRALYCHILKCFSSGLCGQRTQHNWGSTLHELLLDRNITENSRCCWLNETTNQRFAIKPCFISAALTLTHWKGLFWCNFST